MSKKIVRLSEEHINNATGIIPSDKTKIIRYMSLSKFYSLITSNTLWFPRPDQFTDEFEGFATIEINNKGADYFRKLSLISCWNEFESESFALWKIYLGNKQAGIGLVSTVGDFMQSITNDDDRDSITPYKVQYVNPNKKYNGMNNMILITRKKDFYTFENEIRFNYYEGGGRDFEQPKGKAIALDPVKLIGKVILSPYMPIWIRNSLESILEKFNLQQIILEESLVRDKMLK